jgi:5,10-methylene-tetrahydrofolate dehydrogenase/methenyl tetrahydrofolate cyclohydrolase
MRPTYSVAEIKLLIKDLDVSSINVLRELVEEEKECFSPCELKAVNKFIELKNKDFVNSQVKVEFLLSFN